MTGPGLRERKKARTRHLIQESALRLISEQGYEATTVEQIASAAEVSPSTFFRYFPTKEDVVLRDDYDPMLVAGLERAPAELTPVQAFRAVAADLFQRLPATERDDIYQRSALTYHVPELRARILQGSHESARIFSEVIAKRVGRSSDDREIRVAMAAIMAALVTALEDWVDGGGRADLAEVVDGALALLEGGLVLSPAQTSTSAPAPASASPAGSVPSAGSGAVSGEGSASGAGGDSAAVG